MTIVKELDALHVNWEEYKFPAGEWDMKYSDFSLVTKSGATVTLDLFSEIEPSANFTINAPSEIKEGQMYILRVVTWATPYTMTLWTWITNPYSELTLLTANTVHQFGFLAIDWDLELQPSATSWWWTWWSITWTLSNQTDLQSVLNNKQDKFHTTSSSQPSNPSEWDEWYDSTNDVLKVYDGSNWNVTGKEYNAGPGISIGQYQDYSAMQWPAPSGFHVPSITEWQWLKTIMYWLSLPTWNNWKTNLHIPFAGFRNYSTADLKRQGSYGYYWSSSPDSSDSNNVRTFYLDSSYVNAGSDDLRADGLPVRCFKDSYVAPDSNWTVIAWTLWSAWIFRNQTEWIISITSDWTAWYTIQDKNLWATIVYNDWDTLSEVNCGKYYQWGNNYWFAWTWSVTTSSTQVDASAYWPWNYYSGSAFITWSKDWSSVQNDNLWWWVTWVLTDAITNTGVLSVNWQTGDVTVWWSWWSITWTLSNQTDLQTALNAKANASDVNTKTFYITSSQTSSEQIAVAQDAIDYYVAWNNPIIRYWNSAFLLAKRTNATYTFWSPRHTFAAQIGTSYSSFEVDKLEIWHTDDVASSVTISSETVRYLDPNWSYTTSFIPSSDWQPATKKYVDDSTAKVFYLPNDLTSASALSIAQDAYDWFNAGKTPIIVYKGKTCTVAYSTASWLAFRNARTLIDNTTYSSSWCTAIIQYEVHFTISSWTVTEIIKTEPESYFIDTTTQYTNPFNPTQNYHPATKKYVDDIKPTSWSTAPSTTPTYVGQQYVDTTNNKLYVATWTSSSSDWSEVWSGSWDMAYADFNWVSKTWATVTLDLNSTITPSANFTVNAPATIKDWQVYILRVVSWATAYTMTLGTWITNPYSTSTTLTANYIDQFVFQAIGWSLELLPETDVDITGKQDKATSWSAAPSTTPSYVWQQYVNTTDVNPYIATWTSSSSDWQAVPILSKQTWAATNIKFWIWTTTAYQNLGSYDNNTVYICKQVVS